MPLLAIYTQLLRCHKRGTERILSRCLSGSNRLFNYFACQCNSNFHALHKSSALMIPAEGTDRVNDPIHILQFHAVHGLVQGIEVGLYLPVVHRIHLGVGFVKKGQDRITAAEVWRIVCQAGFELVEIGFHGNTYRKIWVLLPLRCRSFKCQFCRNILRQLVLSGDID